MLKLIPSWGQLGLTYYLHKLSHDIVNHSNDKSAVYILMNAVVQRIQTTRCHISHIILQKMVKFPHGWERCKSTWTTCLTNKLGWTNESVQQGKFYFICLSYSWSHKICPWLPLLTNLLREWCVYYWGIWGNCWTLCFGCDWQRLPVEKRT